MSANQRIDYSASLREAPLYPKIIRAPVMVLSPPPRLVTLLFTALVVAVAATSLLWAIFSGRRPIPVHRAIFRLLGIAVVAFSFVLHCSSFWHDDVYSVRKTLLHTALGTAGGFLAWFSPRMASGLEQ